MNFSNYRMTVSPPALTQLFQQTGQLTPEETATILQLSKIPTILYQNSKIMTTKAYLLNLTKTTEHLIQTVKEMTQTHSREQLAQHPEPNRWLVLDNLEHLNLYNDFYLPTFENVLAKGEANDWKSRETYHSGWLGAYFVKSMKPQGTKIPNKMNTFKDKNPMLTAVPDNVVERFLSSMTVCYKF